jgi:uncharacterized protein YcnI
MTRFSRAATVAAALFAMTSPALAHVELVNDKAPADSSYKAVLMVGHGCAGSPTTELRVQIPEGLILVKPMPKPGWKIAITMQKLAHPIDMEGHQITETVREIEWSGGSLPDNFYDEFVFVGRLPNKPGSVLYLPTVQRCAKGVNRWIDIPAAGQKADDLKGPAPSLTLGPKAAGGE